MKCVNISAIVSLERVNRNSRSYKILLFLPF